MDLLIMAAIALGVDVLSDNIGVLRKITHRNTIVESTNELIRQAQQLLQDPDALKAFLKGDPKAVESPSQFRPNQE